MWHVIELITFPNCHHNSLIIWELLLKLLSMQSISSWQWLSTYRDTPPTACKTKSSVYLSHILFTEQVWRIQESRQERKREDNYSGQSTAIHRCMQHYYGTVTRTSYAPNACEIMGRSHVCDRFCLFPDVIKWSFISNHNFRNMN